MNALEEITARARGDKRTIVLPEGGDARVLAAAGRVVERGVAEIILIGDPDADNLRHPPLHQFGKRLDAGAGAHLLIHFVGLARLAPPRVFNAHPFQELRFGNRMHGSGL